jgi:hypothetical protein
MKFYQIHNIINFSIQNNNNFLKKLIDATDITFENFEVEQVLHDLDFMIEIGPFKSSRNGCKILDDNYHIKRNCLIFADRKKFSKWKIEISDLERNPKIKIQTNTAGSVRKPLNFIEFFIQYKLLHQNYITIHSAGLEKNGSVILLPGTSGGGKTTISLSLIELGYNYLGDNYIIIHNNRAFSYLTPLNIFFYNRVPLIEKSLSHKQKFDLYLRKIIYQVTGGYIKIFKKINPKTVIGNRTTSFGNIKKLCFIEPNMRFDSETPDVNHIGINEAAKKMRFNMELEWIQFCKFIYSYGYLMPKSIFSDLWDQYEVILTKNIDSVKEFYSIRVPVSYSKQSISKVINRILD